MINGDTLNKKLSDAEWLCGAGASSWGCRTRGFWTTCSFRPTAGIRREAEKQPMLDALRKARTTTGSPEVQREAHRQALEDMMWAMLTSKEFLFNY